MLVENMEEFESRAFATDKGLLQGLVGFKPTKGRAFGLVFISPESSCVNCGGKLILRKDRPASLVSYMMITLVLFLHCISTKIVAITHALSHSTMATTLHVVTICVSSTMPTGAAFHTLLPHAKQCLLPHCLNNLTVRL